MSETKNIIHYDITHNLINHLINKEVNKYFNSLYSFVEIHENILYINIYNARGKDIFSYKNKIKNTKDVINTIELIKQLLIITDFSCTLEFNGIKELEAWINHAREKNKI